MGPIEQYIHVKTNFLKKKKAKRWDFKPYPNGNSMFKSSNLIVAIKLSKIKNKKKKRDRSFFASIHVY